MRNYIFLVLFIFLFCFGFSIDKASAAPKLEVNAEVGINGQYKDYTPVPMKITVTNNGSDFSGDLVIDAYETYNTGSAIVYPLNIAEGETKTISLILNSLGESMNPQQQIFYFYEGGIEKGKSIDYKGSKTLRSMLLPSDTIFLYTLTENSDRLSGLFQLNEDAYYGLEIFHLNDIKNYELPSEAKELQMANILLVDEVSLSDLSNDQQQALFDWVQSGGILLVGASDQISNSMGIFQSHLPLNLSNDRVTVSATDLSQLTKGGKFDKNIEVQKATENKDSEIVLKAGDTILAASKKIGTGQIIQTTFSLGDQPLTGMAGYAKLVSTILKLENYNPNPGYMYSNGFYNALPYELSYVNEIFPSFEVTIVWIVIVIIIYILIIGPILYIVLKRMDKREHTWWVIPVLAIALSVVMFIFGARDRMMNAQIQQSSILKVNEDKSLEGYYMNSLLTNKGGDYKFNTDENTTIASTNVGDYYDPLLGTTMNGKLHENSYITQHAKGSTLTLRNLKYWSVQSMVGKSKIKDAGNLDIDITVSNNNLKGTIKNNFPFKLKNVAIWSGNNEIEIGDLEPNKTLKVSKKIKSSTLLSPNYVYMGMSMTPKKKDELLNKRLDSLKPGLVDLTLGESLPIVIGWTEELLIGAEMEGNNKVDAVNYIAQTFKPKVELNGDFSVSSDVLITDLIPINNSIGYSSSMNPNEWELQKGEYEYSITVPEEISKQAKSWKEIYIGKMNSNLTNVQIWNEKKRKFEDLPQNRLIDSEVSDYISEGFIRLKFTFDGEDYSVVRMPEVLLKGVAK